MRKLQICILIYFYPFHVKLTRLIVRYETFLIMVNINNMFRKFLRQRFYHWFIIKYSVNVASRFLRPDLPRACLVYEVTRTTIDVLVWTLICQVHQLTLLDTSVTAPSTIKGRHWLTKIAYHSLLARARVTSIITCARICLVKGKLVAWTKAMWIKHINDKWFTDFLLP